MAASCFRTFRHKLMTANRAPEPGDFVRVGAHDARHLIGDSQPKIIEIWFPYLPADGLAQVIAVQGAALDVLFWGRAMRVAPRDAPYRPLSHLGRLLARQRIGVWLIERAIQRAAPPKGDPAKTTPAQPLSPRKQRAATARGGLRVVQALGGRWPLWWQFHGWLALRRMARMVFAYPEDRRHGPHGILVQNCSAILRFYYHSEKRVFRLDQVRRHPNDNIHLLGRLLPSGEARTFTLHGISGLEIDGFGHADDTELWVELHALTSTAASHHQIWAKWCAQQGLAIPPQPSRMAQWCERLRLGVQSLARRLRPLREPRLIAAADRQRPLFRLKRKLQGLRDTLRRKRNDLAWRLRDWRGLPPKPSLRGPNARWRRFLTHTADQLDAGETVDPRRLLGLHKLRHDPVFARRLLRAMLRHTQPPDPWARSCLAAALAVSPDHRKVIPYYERRQAFDLCGDMQIAGLEVAPLRWHKIHHASDDPALLLTYAALNAIYAPDIWTDVGKRFNPRQALLKAPFLSALFLFLAEWDGARWHLTAQSSAKLRWMARFQGRLPR